MKKNILFIKTAKTATESIRFHLKEYCKKEKLVDNDGFFSAFFHKKKFNVNTNHIFWDDKYINHFYNAIDENLDTLVISSVRHPLERLYSHYCYSHPMHRKGMDFNEWYVKTINGEIEDRWGSPGHRDKTHNYMAGYMGIESIDQLWEKYDFIFVKEYFKPSLELFGGMIGFQFSVPNKKNVNPSSKKDYVFTQEVIDLFNEHNKLDNEIYKQVLRKNGFA